jgi:Tfp pilus assembly protein PilV
MTNFQFLIFRNKQSVGLRYFGKRRLLEGQLLVEVILAVAVAIVVLAALVSLATLAIKFSRSSLERSMAEKLALGGVEAIRITRDRSVGGYNSFVDDGYYAVTSSGLVRCAGSRCASSECGANFDKIVTETNTFFCRKIQVSSDKIDGSSHYRDVYVEVRWKEGVGDRVTYLPTRIFR